MKKQLLAVLCAASMIASSFAVPVTAVSAAETGTTYYVSSVNGDNKNAGTSEDKAWQTLDKLSSVVGTLQPGDKILLEAGSVFNGFIHLKDVHGTKENPIVISSYGEGNSPIINCNSQGIWYQDYGKALDNSGHKGKGYVSSAINLYDVDYVEVSNLEITNTAEEVDLFEEGEKLANHMDRTGVSGIAKDGGTMRGITLSNLYIHDVEGNLQDKHMNNGGIQMNVLQPEDEAATGIARYQDILIENCYVEDVSRAGIVVGYTYNYDKFYGSEISDDIAKQYGHTNVVFRNNYVKETGNDGIVVMYSYKPLVENNVSDTAGVDVVDNEIWQRFCCAIWPWKCKDAVLQRNEAFDTVGTNNGDGQAWDIDYSDSTVYQYNYSHNNGGGSMLICLTESYNGTYRYNISQNDLHCFVTLQGNPLAYIYNNVFYVDGDRNTRIHHSADGKRSGAAVFENNIFFNASTANPNDKWENNGNQTFSNNLYYGYSAAPSTDKNAVVVTNPAKVFVDPGKAPNETTGTIHAVKDFEGYKLASDSPAINAGTFVTPGEDFFGNKIGRIPDIGIHEINTEDEDIIVDVVSGEYDVDASALTIFNVEFNTLAKDFKGNLTYSDGLTLKLTDKDGKEKSDNKAVVTGDKLVVSYQSESKTYTVRVNAEVLKVASSSYIVKSNEVQNVPKNTTVSTFLSNIDHEDHLTIAVKGKSGSDIVKNGDILEVTSKNTGSVYEYTIALVKEYKEYDVAGMKATVGSQQLNNATEGGGELALDGNSGTLWHTAWSGTARENCWISIDMGEEKEVSMFKYVPRAPQKNGNITGYEIYVSDDNKTWGAPVASGAWEDDGTVKYANFDEVSCRYVKLVATNTVSNEAGKIFAAAVEVRVGYEVKED